MKKTAYTAPTLEKVELSANDVLLASGGVTPGFEARGTLDTFDVTSEQYQRKTWADFFSY